MASLAWKGFLLAGFLLGVFGLLELIDRANEPRPFVLGTAEIEPRTVVVELQGAVRDPGLYELPHGSRLADLFIIAGGLLPEADASQLNGTALLQDGQQVFVPRAGDALQEVAAGLVDINTADQAQLEELPNIGPVRAGAIIESREREGPFQAPEDLVLRDIISLSLFESIRDRITVSR